MHVDSVQLGEKEEEEEEEEEGTTAATHQQVQVQLGESWPQSYLAADTHTPVYYYYCT